jgi:hypothetical protein
MPLTLTAMFKQILANNPRRRLAQAEAGELITGH